MVVAMFCNLIYGFLSIGTLVNRKLTSSEAIIPFEMFGFIISINSLVELIAKFLKQCAFIILLNVFAMLYVVVVTWETIDLIGLLILWHLILS